MFSSIYQNSQRSHYMILPLSIVQQGNNHVRIACGGYEQLGSSQLSTSISISHETRVHVERFLEFAIKLLTLVRERFKCSLQRRNSIPKVNSVSFILCLPARKAKNVRNKTLQARINTSQYALPLFNFTKTSILSRNEKLQHIVYFLSLLDYYI